MHCLPLYISLFVCKDKYLQYIFGPTWLPVVLNTSKNSFKIFPTTFKKISFVGAREEESWESCCGRAEGADMPSAEKTGDYQILIEGRRAHLQCIAWRIWSIKLQFLQLFLFTAQGTF